MQPTFARTTLGALVALACTLAFAELVAAAQTATASLDGYTPAHAAREQAYEQRFQQSVDPRLAGRRQPRAVELQPSRRHRRRPPRLRAVDGHAALVRPAGPQLALQRLPLQAAQHPGVDDQADTQRPLPRSRTTASPGCRTTQDVVLGYNAYSPPGDVTAPVVYANYGLPQDYAALDKLGVVGGAARSCSSATARASAASRSTWPSSTGAIGVIIYSDPKDDGFTRGPGLSRRPVAPGGLDPARLDPVPLGLPGRPADAGQAVDARARKRLEPDAGDRPARRSRARRSPTATRSRCCRRSAGPRRPTASRAGWAFQYHVGPGPTEAHLNLDIAYDTETRHGRDRRRSAARKHPDAEGHGRRPLGRLDVRHQRQRQRPDRR